MSISRTWRLVLLPMMLTAAAGQSFAQDVTIEFTNSDLPPIPLLQGTSVGIDGEGNLTAQCVLDGTTCQGVTTEEPAGPVPVVTLSRTNGTAPINTGGTLALGWSIQNGADVCLATSSPVVSGWNNTVVAANGGSANLTMSAPGAFALSLKCYNSHGASESATVNVTVQGQQQVNQIPVCNEPGFMESGKVQPTGFTGNLVQWPNMFYGASFPETPSFAAPVGAFTLRTLAGHSSNNGPPMNGRYLTVPFVPQANKNYKLSFMGVQAVYAAQYYNSRAAETVFVSISPCAGDLRKKNTSGDSWLARCRTQGSNVNMFYNTTGAAAGCPLQAGETYFLNIAFVDTNLDPLSTSETTCAVSGNRCEVNADN